MPSIVPSPLRRASRKALTKAVPATLHNALGLGVAPELARLAYSLEDGTLHLSGLYAARRSRVVGVEATVAGGVEKLSVTNELADGQFDVDVDLALLRDTLGVGQDANVELWLVAEAPTGRVRTRLGRFASTQRPAAPQVTELDGVRVAVETTLRHNLVLRFGPPSPRPPAITTRRIEPTRAGRLRLELAVGADDVPAEAVALLAVGRQTHERYLVPLPTPTAHVQSSGYGRLVVDLLADVDLGAVLDDMPDHEDTIDLFVALRPGAEDEILARVPGVRGLRGRRLRSAPVPRGDGSDTTLLVPYLTFRGKSLSYRIERFTTANYRYLRRLSRLGWVFTVMRPFTRVWLIGEVPYKAQDNGFQLFRYIRRNHPGRRAYYVIDAGSPDRARVAELGNVVDRFSREHIRAAFMASRLVGSHHAEYLLASRDRRAARWARGVRVFLQHGPTASKNVVPNYGRQGTAERPTERFIVTSDLEKRIVVEDYGYRPHQVSVTGFARFDQLFAGDVEREPVVLVMPTWRDSLMLEEVFLASDYYANWHGFLQSPALQELLGRAGMRVKLVLHPNMRKYADHFESELVELVRQEEVDVQRLLKSSAVLITDFSSVSWDFSYLRRPVLFFQFDRTDLVGKRAPHIDFDTMLPGPILDTPDRLVAALQDAVDRDLAMPDEYYARARAFLKYDDRNSCARIYDVVRRSWNVKVALERVRNNSTVQLGWRVFRRSPQYWAFVRAIAWFGRLLPRTDVVLFEADRGMGYGDSPRYLYERLCARDHGLRLVWANNTTLRLTDPSTTKITRHSVRYWWTASRARYWVNNQNFPAELRKSPRTRFLQTWHGTPLKKMQHDVENMLGRDEEYQARAARLTSYWDALLSASPYATAAFRSAFRYEGPILERGYPRNDVFSWPGAEQRVARVRARLGLVDDPRRVVLYAPTFRDDARDGVHWRHDLALDLGLLRERLGDDVVLLVRFHQLVRDRLPAEWFDSDFVVDASRYPDVQELLMASDVLVTDYSSLFFDYAALGRPMVFFAYDLERYRDQLRGFYLDYDSQVPGPIVTTNEALADVLADLDAAWAPYVDRLTEFQRTYGPLDDGGASDRVLDEFFGSAIGPAPAGVDLSRAARPVPRPAVG